jgi:hypothetical protein
MVATSWVSEANVTLDTRRTSRPEEQSRASVLLSTFAARWTEEDNDNGF